MKKLLLTILVLSINVTTYAQDEKLKFGVKAGLNIANATGNGVQLFTNEKSADSRLGIALGGFLDYILSEKFSLQPELLYSQQGFKSEDATVQLDYINIPVLIKYKISTAFSLLAGPQIGFLLSSKLNFEENEPLAFKSTMPTTDLKEFFSKTDFGLNFGLSYKLDNGFGINTNYNLGLKDIFDFNSIDTDIEIEAKNELNSKNLDSDFVIKNRVFNVAIFYTF